ALVARRRDHAGRLVQHQVDRPLGRTDRFAVDRHALAGLHLDAGLRHHAVDRHAAGRDQGIGSAARGDARAGQEQVQTGGGCHRAGVSWRRVEIAAQAPHAEATALDLLERHVPYWRIIVAVLGAPLVLDAIAFGIGSDVAAWWAPWSLFGACGFVAGVR